MGGLTGSEEGREVGVAEERMILAISGIGGLAREEVHDASEPVVPHPEAACR